VFSPLGRAPTLPTYAQLDSPTDPPHSTSFLLPTDFNQPIPTHSLAHLLPSQNQPSPFVHGTQSYKTAGTRTPAHHVTGLHWDKAAQASGPLETRVHMVLYLPQHNSYVLVLALCLQKDVRNQCTRCSRCCRQRRSCWIVERACSTHDYNLVTLTCLRVPNPPFKNLSCVLWGVWVSVGVKKRGINAASSGFLNTSMKCCV
jgi:hypothetical protein